ncbi:MAG: hypothetical protein Q9221_008437 [Calogaya cf. arnoldii]
MTYLKYDFLDWAQFFVALLVTKISICLFLLRLSQFDRLRTVLYGLIWLLVTTHIPLFFIYVFQCDPVRKAWDKEMDGKCMSMDIVQNVITAQGAISAITDIMRAAFPLLLLWNVKIRTKTKVGICLLMGAGIMFVASATSKLQGEPPSLSLAPRKPTILTSNPGVGVPGALTRVFEVNIGIMAACAPILRPFIRYVKARITGQDPHHILRPFPTQSFHSSWYTRLWRSRSSAKESDPRGFHRPENNEWGRVKGGEASNGTDVTISLPIQGIRDREDSRGVMMPDKLKMYDSGSTIMTQKGKDMV